MQQYEQNVKTSIRHISSALSKILSSYLEDTVQFNKIYQVTFYRSSLASADAFAMAFTLRTRPGKYSRNINSFENDH